MSDNMKKRSLTPRFKASMKASRQSCPFIKPGRIMKEGRMVDAKCCTAFMPAFEITDDRAVCEMCTVPDMGVREDRCRFFSPLSIAEGSAPRWHCRLLGDKNIEPEQCSPERCPHFEAIERLKWEIGRPVGKVERPEGEPKPGRMRLVPKSEEMRRRHSAKKNASEDDSQGGGGYCYW